tara:strand:- start:91 stop:645 length:555 start_codon:yes stop_codon:yes gene_type:complete
MHKYNITKRPVTKQAIIIETLIQDLSIVESLKKKIDEKVGVNDYKTNVRGQMSGWLDLLHENSFKEILGQNKDLWMTEFPYIDTYIPYEAWGNKLKKNDLVEEHQHTPATVSGIIYLTNEGPGTFFPEVDYTVKEEIGKVVLFSSDLKHSVDKFTFDGYRYTISFNLKEPHDNFKKVNQKYGNK